MKKNTQPEEVAQSVVPGLPDAFSTALAKIAEAYETTPRVIALTAVTAYLADHYEWKTGLPVPLEECERRRQQCWGAYRKDTEGPNAVENWRGATHVVFDRKEQRFTVLEPAFNWNRRQRYQILWTSRPDPKRFGNPGTPGHDAAAKKGYEFAVRLAATLQRMRWHGCLP